MKTTINIADTLFLAAKREARKRGVTFREVVESALLLLLDPSKTGKRPFTLRRHTFRGKGLQEGITEGDWNRVRDLTYEGRGG